MGRLCIVYIHPIKKICPYCHNARDTYVSPDGLKAYRPNIDHYYPQAEFPLALTMEFHPCCRKCNGPDKATRFDLTPHLHPLVDANIFQAGQRLGLNKLRLQADSGSQWHMPESG